MIFVDYKEANHVQNLIAEKFCPGLVNDPVEENVATEKKAKAYVQVMKNATTTAATENSYDSIFLREWLKAKRSTLEWALGLNEGATCTAKTRFMEDKLAGHEEGFLHASEVI
jgi:hypothetical protein